MNAPLDLAAVDAAIERHGADPAALIPLLQAIQRHYRWLPPAALARLAERTRIHPTAISGVATFYDQFRHRPAGRHLIHICHGTACHVKGSERIEDAFRRRLGLAPGQDTDAQGEFTLQGVACLGCCTLAPVVQAGGATYGHLTPERIVEVLADVQARERAGAIAPVAAPAGGGPELRVGCGSCCLANGAGAVRSAMERELVRLGRAATIRPVGCVGMCHATPLVEVAGGATYGRVGPREAAAIVRRHLPPRGLGERLRRAASAMVDRLAGDDERQALRGELHPRDPQVCAFLGPQKRLATADSGEVEPLDLAAWRARGAFAALAAARAMDPDLLVSRITVSGLRGRGGAGFPTGRKWAAVRAALKGAPSRSDGAGAESRRADTMGVAHPPAASPAQPEKPRDDKARGGIGGEAPGADCYMICNGDEGDPGAFMDRMLLESFPFRVLEGMAIAAHAVGASEGILYIRAEYPLAVERIRAAIAACAGLLAPLRLRVVEGAGAFVCGEETALIASVEGRRGMPRLRPPFPAESGLHGHPTCVNNVETLALVPWIVTHGAEAFAAIGTAGSAGTKVFALAGKVARGGLIEVPMGTSLRTIVEEIGGGVAGGGTFKAVQIGGPSGGCIPAAMCDLPVDYGALAAAGAIMGSGGLVVLDRRDCMVDIARYFLRFTQEQSCGKCTFCRLGTRRMLDILDRLCAGQGRPADLLTLEELALQTKASSLCGLGQTAPNPVLTTLRHFRDEYEAHLAGRCPAGRCSALIRYAVTDACTGCSKCAQLCPVQAIPFTPYRRHAIDAALCTRCDQCRVACPAQAIEVA